MPHFVLEVPQGADVVRAIIAFARSGPHLTGTVLSATGTVDRLCFYNRGAQPQYVAIDGAYRLVSLSGYFNRLPSGDYYWPSFSAVLSFESGTIFGGVLAGSIVASQPVTVVLSVLEDPSFIGLTLNADNAPEENEPEDNAAEDNAPEENAEDNAAEDNSPEDNAAEDNEPEDNAAEENAAEDNAAAANQGDAENGSPTSAENGGRPN